MEVPMKILRLTKNDRMKRLKEECVNRFFTMISCCAGVKSNDLYLRVPDYYDALGIDITDFFRSDRAALGSSISLEEKEPKLFWCSQSNDFAFCVKAINGDRIEESNGLRIECTGRFRWQEENEKPFKYSFVQRFHKDPVAYFRKLTEGFLQKADDFIDVRGGGAVVDCTIGLPDFFDSKMNEKFREGTIVGFANEVSIKARQVQVDMSTLGVI